MQPQTRRQEQWTIDTFWEIVRPQQPEQDQPGPSTQQNYTPMEKGEIELEPDQHPSVREVPAMNWAKYVGVKSVQYLEMGHVP